MVAIALLALTTTAGLGVAVIVAGRTLDAQIIGSAIGFTSGHVVVLGKLLRAPRDRRPPIALVPDVVLRAAPAGADAADVWRWSVAVTTEDAARPAIGYETYVERPFMQEQADRARERYAAVYRAYLAAARESGVPPHEPAIPLGAADQSGMGSSGGSGGPMR
ncbi:hypothetical protein DEI83_07870 [Curtobacterium sp. MCBD17_021]|nr:hypothetical protein DEI83_07870 [Curtobacterium sp. MCBD17_021]